MLRLREQVVERLIDERLVAQRGGAARASSVSDAELAEQIIAHRRVPGGRALLPRPLRAAPRDDPAPDDARRDFETDFRAELVRQRLQALITDGAKVSEAEVAAGLGGGRGAACARATSWSPPGRARALSATDAELEAYYKAHPAEFTQPERRRVLAAILPAASVPPPAVTDADIEAAYKARRSQFEQPAADEGLARPDQGARGRRQRGRGPGARPGPRRRSPGSAAAPTSPRWRRRCRRIPRRRAAGGDLGLIAAGELVPEVDKLIQSLKPGELGGPVRSPFGFHVVKVFEVVPGSRKELKEVAPDPPGDARRRGAAEGPPGPGAGGPAGAPGRGRFRGGGAPARPHGAGGGPAAPGGPGGGRRAAWPRRATPSSPCRPTA